jgi:FtsH-binding integral membrane protein
MMIGITITGITAYAVASQPQLVMQIVQNKILFFGLVILQLGAVIALTAWVQRMTIMTASLVYTGYAALTGLTFSTIFLAYTMESISSTFFVTAFAFGGLSLFGYTTKRDLGPIGSFCMIGLFGMIAVMLVGFFIPSMMGNSMQLTMASIGVLVFAGLTAYDTQRIKSIGLSYTSSEMAAKGAIYGALILYLDFINLFLNLLRLMGDRR